MRLGLFIASLLLLVPVSALAQSLEGAIASTNPFTISMEPSYPTPMGSVTLSFVSSTINLANATMSVTAGGKSIYQGSVQPVAVIVGKAGSVTTVVVTMTSAGTKYSQTIALQPQDVSLVAEPLSSAPAMYPGKPLVPLEGNTRVVAIAHLVDTNGKTIPADSLSYTWTVEGAEIANSSGIGKQAVIVASPIQYRSRTVSVLVQSQVGALVGQASLSISPRESTVRIYESDPLLGIRYEHALSDSYSIGSAETSLYAVPFSLSLASGRPLVEWFLNGTKAQTGNLITLRPTGSGQGTATLSLTASGGTDNVSGATASLTLIFGAKPRSNFFGL